jgi:hypothetical protein
MTVREFLAGLQHLPIDAEVLAFEAGCEEYCEREIDEVEDLLDRPGHVPGVAQVAFACRAADVSAGAALLRAWLPPTATAGAAVRAVLAVAVSAGDRAVTLATRAADLAVGAVARDDADRITAQPSLSLVAPRDGRRPSVVNGARILREGGFDRGAPGKWPFPNRTATP